MQLQLYDHARAVITSTTQKRVEQSRSLRTVDGFWLRPQRDANWFAFGRSENLRSLRCRGLGLEQCLDRQMAEPSNGSEHVGGPKSLEEILAIQRKTQDHSPPVGPVPPVLLLLVGAAGSGRSTFYRTHLETGFPKRLQTSASPLEHAETDRARKRLLKVGESFVYVGDLFDLEVIRAARTAGYDVKAVYLATEDPTLNLGRALIRVNNGGRFAPMSRIANDYVRGLSQLPKLKKLSDDLMLFDNTAHARDARLVAHFQGGKLVKLAREIPKWAQKAFGSEFTSWLAASS
jgi:predicted ABC-type ATPase